MIAKSNDTIASLKTDLEHPVKQLETMTTSKDTRIASFEAAGKKSLPIVETFDLTSKHKAKLPRTKKYVVVDRSAMQEQNQRFFRVKRRLICYHKPKRQATTRACAAHFKK